MGLLSRLKLFARRRRLERKRPIEIFSDYARRNKWGDKDSLSGKGSNLDSTKELRRLLPALLQELGARSLLDVPCGDFFWMQHVDLAGVDYLGGDIVPELIAANEKAHARPGIKFQVVDLISGPVPGADVIFVRDCLVHLSNDHACRALANIARSGGKWLVSTTFPETSVNEDIATGEWRSIDLTKPPFSLSQPERLLFEGQGHVKGQRPDKCLGLWRIESISQKTDQA
jgi:SAM-dependent methyltransferase